MPRYASPPGRNGIPTVCEISMEPDHIVIRTEDNRIFYDMPDISPCNGCGACCRTLRVSFYQGELDTFPGGFVPAQLTRQVTPFIACMQGTENGRQPCVALQPDLRCGIYSQRPSTCREFPAYLEDGRPNPRCQELRARLGLAEPQPG